MHADLGFVNSRIKMLDRFGAVAMELALGSAPYVLVRCASLLERVRYADAEVRELGRQQLDLLGATAAAAAGAFGLAAAPRRPELTRASPGLRESRTQFASLFLLVRIPARTPPVNINA